MEKYAHLRAGDRRMRTYIEIGKIVNTHGVKGALKVEPWCDSPAVLAGMKTLYFAPGQAGEAFPSVKVRKGSVQKDRVLLTLEGVETMEAAMALKNTVLYAHRDDIPREDGAFLIDDLKGLPLYGEADGRFYGTLHDVIQGAASDLYEIKTEKGMVLMPVVKEFVKHIDLETGIVIAPIAGMFDEN
ncbi:MAG: 16S rRNA processing protein RimM [Ruminococcaceae bacterium]|nr:16S rRNA processing protein RimM [Oscillospiraceae bacterium]